jgi:hypothetical protein
MPLLCARRGMWRRYPQTRSITCVTDLKVAETSASVRRHVWSCYRLERRPPLGRELTRASGVGVLRKSKILEGDMLWRALL